MKLLMEQVTFFWYPEIYPAENLTFSNTLRENYYPSNFFAENFPSKNSPAFSRILSRHYILLNLANISLM